MTELIALLQEKAGITGEQATKSLHAIKEYVTGKFPMLAGAVDNMFAGATDKAVEQAPIVAEPVKIEEPGMLDKISDVIPGETGQKIEDLVKNAADKAEEAYDAVREKITGFFGSKDDEAKKA